MDGFVKIPRSLFGSRWWKQKRVFSETEAFIDLYQNGMVETSLRTLADRWIWNQVKTKRFLDRLQKEGYVSVTTTLKGTTIRAVGNEGSVTPSVTPDSEKCNTKTPINTGVSEGQCNTSTVTGVTPSVTLKEVPLLPPDKETSPITPKEINPPISPQENLPPVSRAKRFVKPSVKEIRSYCDEKGYGIDAEQFWNFYESKGWVVGKSPMKSWKAAIITWLKRNHATTTTIRKPYQSEGTPSNGQLVSDTEELIQRLAAQRRNRNTEVRQR